jgi:glycosyltransferase involved in cell wall biosynthesis
LELCCHSKGFNISENPKYLKKLLLILHYPPPIHGAAAVGSFIKQSYSFNLAFNAQYVNLSTSLSVDDIGKNSFSKWWRYAKIVLRTFQKGLLWRPQLVYITLTTHGLGLWKDAAIVAVCRVLGLKHVLHFHNKGVMSYSQKNKYANALYCFVFKKAKVILLSPLLYQDIAVYVGIEKVFFCANGIPDVSEETIIEQRPSNAPVELLFLSNLIVSKGIWDLLDACQILKNKGIAFKCSLVGGEGDIRVEELETQIRNLGLDDNVSYLGKYYGDSKTAIFQSADIFVHPTHEDCFPLVLLEAMQFSLPVVSTEEGAISEIVDDGKTGFLIPPKDPQALAEKLELLILNSELRTQMGVAGRKKYESAYTLEHFEKRFIDILDRINQSA